MSSEPKTQGWDAFARATYRLAILFGGIVTLLLAVSAAVLYFMFTAEVHNVIDLQVANEELERELVEQAIISLRYQLLAIEGSLFVAVGVLGLWYARRAMKPIHEALENERRFIANASHELRTPLAIMKADLEVARRGPSGTDELEQAIDSGLEEVDRMSGMVADLLTLSRIDARQEQLERTQVDLVPLVDVTVQKMSALAAAHGVHLTAGCSCDAFDASVDAERLQRALFNVIKNAVEHSAAGSSVAVRLHDDGRAARIEVVDHGVGIPEDKLDDVFERFYRADVARSSATGGSGLGLPIAKWIVEAHGGALRLESVLGKGTIATITLPI
jgi:two-component system sensor histidine kinase CiaH